MDDNTDDGTNGWKGRPPPDRLRILHIKIVAIFFPQKRRKLETEIRIIQNNFRKMAKGRLKKSHWVRLEVCPLRKK